MWNGLENEIKSKHFVQEDGYLEVVVQSGACEFDLGHLVGR